MNNIKKISNDLSIIVLTKNEKLHIERCINNIRLLTDNIYIIDSYSTDGTQQIAKSLGANVIEHEWPGNQAEQFNWALDSIPIKTKWILRLDADEYLLPELINEITEKLPSIPQNINGITLKRRHIFMNKWIKKGIYPVKLLRLFRKGYGKYENRIMDEHLALYEGGTLEFENDFCDHNLNNISWFCQKHIDYATREAAEMLNYEFKFSKDPITNIQIKDQAKEKREKKNIYSRLPLFWRSFAYFIFRFFAKGAWRDGKEGFIFTFIQGWWYRMLVDAKIYEIKKKCGCDSDKIKLHLKNEYNISFD